MYTMYRGITGCRSGHLPRTATARSGRGRGEERREQRKLFCFVFWTTNETLRISEYFQYPGDHVLFWGFVLKCQVFFFKSSTVFLLKLSFYSVKKSTMLGTFVSALPEISVRFDWEREGRPLSQGLRRLCPGDAHLQKGLGKPPFHSLNSSPRR